MPIDLICLDADDTLWHNMRHFEEAHHAFTAMLRPFAAADVALETLDACEARNLKLYGYGAKGFTLSMIETALELGGDRLPSGVIADILTAGRRLLAHPVELLHGIEGTLDALSQRGRLVLITKGDLLHQEAKLAASGLGDRFAGIEIVSDKTSETFTRLFDRYGVAPRWWSWQAIRCAPTFCPPCRPGHGPRMFRSRWLGRTRRVSRRSTIPAFASCPIWRRCPTGSTRSAAKCLRPMETSRARSIGFA